MTLKASVTTLTAKVETLNKNIALQKETEKELQVSKTVNICCLLTQLMASQLTGCHNVLNSVSLVEKFKSLPTVKYFCF